MNSPNAKWLCRLWYGIGWFGLAFLFYLSLSPRPPEIPIAQGDKLGHALAYAALMFWWAQLLVSSRARLWLAAGLIVLGVAIEYLQGWSGWRAFDVMDMLADAVGVAFGWILVMLLPNFMAMGEKPAS